MKIKYSFLFSIILHAVLVAAVVLSTLHQKEEKDEEITLELTLESTNSVDPSTQKTPAPSQTDVVQTKQTPQVEKSTPMQEVHEEAIIEKNEPTFTPQKESVATPKVVSAPTQTVATVQSPSPRMTPTPPSPTQPITAPVNLEKQYLDDHLGGIRDILIKYRKYPIQALRLKQEGSVKVSFRLKTNGEVEDIHIAGSSGFELLDEDAINLIQKSAQYFPKPPKSVRITVPLSYSLKR